jgi:hypothetical protein
MALTPKRLYTGNDTASNVYTASSTANSYSIIKTISICNTTTTDKTVTIHLVPNSGSAGANNKIMSNVVVPANDTIYSNMVYVLNAGDAVYYDPQDSNLTLVLTGVEYSA